MADIRAFRGLRYNTEKISDFDLVISPPYDVISQKQREKLLSRSPWNIVRLILPDGKNPYENAHSTLQSWIHQGILRQDRDKSIYCYHQTFQTPDGERTRKGFLARIRLEELDRGIVLPHESTLAAPKEDRLQLLRACRTNFSPIFSLYSDPSMAIEKHLEPFTAGPPAARAEIDGVHNSLWTVSDPEVIRNIEQFFRDHWVLIADGHHRYESCLQFRDEMSQSNPDPEAPFQFTLMYFSNLNHPGITVLPYNRGVLNLEHFQPQKILQASSAYFEIREIEDDGTAEVELKVAGKKGNAFLVRFAENPICHLFQLKSETDLSRFYPAGTPEAIQKLDVNILHKIVLEQILAFTEEDIRSQKYLRYYKNSEEERNDLDQGNIQIGFFLNPTRVEQVVEVSKAGRKMPQKSTFFYPKLMTGIVLNQHNEEP